MKVLRHLARNANVRVALSLALVGSCSCTSQTDETLYPELAFRISAESGLTAARDLTVDHEGNIFVFDYDDYAIHKFDPFGTQLAEFGGKGEEPGLFQHLMAIEAQGDTLVALDAGSIAVFDATGEFRSRRSFVDTVVCDLPRLHTDGQWAGEWIIEATAEKVFTTRSADGVETNRLRSFALREFFPGLDHGQMFFINATQLRSYLYDFDNNGRLIWAVSDRFELFVDERGGERRLFHKEAIAVPYPPEEIAALEALLAESEPPLFLNVPTHYQIIHQLMVDDEGDVWLYVVSQEHCGVLRISSAGALNGSYHLEAGFDPMSARLTAANGRLYFLVGSRGGTEIFVVDVP